MRPRTIIIVCIAVIVIAVILLALLHNNGGSLATSTNAPAQTSGFLPTSTIPTSQIYPNAPTGDTLSIGTPQGTVTMKNFYESNPPIGDDGVIIFKQTGDYWFTYDPSDSSFWIAVSSTPFESVRQTAEQDFLTTLQISQSDACKLDVTEGVPYTVGNPLDGQSFQLSFCTGGAFGSQ